MKRAFFIAVILVLGVSPAVSQPGVSSAAEVRFKAGSELGWALAENCSIVSGTVLKVGPLTKDPTVDDSNAVQHASVEVRIDEWLWNQRSDLGGLIRLDQSVVPEKRRFSSGGKETLSKRRNSPATAVASASDNFSQVIPARAETAPTHFLAAPLDLEHLTNNADVIIIGRVNSISNAERVTATLGIDKVVKGDADGRTVDFAFFPNRPSVYVRIQPEVFGMFFLKRKEGGYRVLDPTYPAVIAPANAVLSKEGGLARTVNVVGQVLLTSPAAEDRRVAVSVLRGAPTDRATELLRQGAKDTDSVVRMQSISALLNRNDIETLALAERILLNPPAGTEPYLLDNISAALEGIKDPLAIPTLQRLLRSSNSRTRWGTASALRQMRVMEAVEGLVIALGDNDRDVRYEGVIGLAEFTGQNDWAPDVGSFARDEQKYLDHWKEWSRNR